MKRILAIMCAVIICFSAQISYAASPPNTSEQLPPKFSQDGSRSFKTFEELVYKVKYNADYFYASQPYYYTYTQEDINYQAELLREVIPPPFVYVPKINGKELSIVNSINFTYIAVDNTLTLFEYPILFQNGNGEQSIANITVKYTKDSAPSKTSIVGWDKLLDKIDGSSPKHCLVPESKIQGNYKCITNVIYHPEHDVYVAYTEEGKLIPKFYFLIDNSVLLTMDFECENRVPDFTDAFFEEEIMSYDWLADLSFEKIIFDYENQDFNSGISYISEKEAFYETVAEENGVKIDMLKSNTTQDKSFKVSKINDGPVFETVSAAIGKDYEKYEVFTIRPIGTYHHVDPQQYVYFTFSRPEGTNDKNYKVFFIDHTGQIQEFPWDGITYNSHDVEVRAKRANVDFKFTNYDAFVIAEANDVFDTEKNNDTNDVINTEENNDKDKTVNHVVLISAVSGFIIAGVVVVVLLLRKRKSLQNKGEY